MKYSKEITGKISAYIANGATNKDAAERAGITEKTFYEWCKKPAFSKTIKEALLTFKETHVRFIAMSPQWQAHAWLLERKFPDEYRPPKQQIEAQVTTQENKEDDDFDKFLQDHPELTEEIGRGYINGKGDKK